MTPQEVLDQLESARAYNALLPLGDLRDPYAKDESGNPIPISPGKLIYEQALDPEGNGMMARLTIPSIGVNLPIYHDADDQSLANGVGHLYGSGLPVGGAGVHSVLTAHSGIIGSSLFNRLHEMVEGDTFQIYVLNEVLWYEVDRIQVVAPDEIGSLGQIPGEDLVTLVTCTPIGVNTDRLLVTGHRIPTPPAAQVAESSAVVGPTAVEGLGFPWWPFPVPAAAILAIGLTRGRSASRAPVRAPSWVPAGMPWAEVTARPAGGDALAMWSKRRARALAGVPSVALLGYAASEFAAPGFAAPRAVRFTDARQVADYARATDSDMAYTWTLRSAAGRALGVSAYVFPTEEAALDDAGRWAQADGLAVRTVHTGGSGRRTTWWIGTAHGEPVLFPMTDTAHTDSASALAALAQVLAAPPADAPQPRTGRHMMTNDGA
jgi:sortase A